MTYFFDGSVAKLRASCDACNESKVRCSQTKPKCGRCEKQGVPCVYGLSHRSHKNAPRIGASQEAANTVPLSPPLDDPSGNSATRSRGQSITSVMTAPSPSGHDAHAHAILHKDIATAVENGFLSSILQSPESRAYAEEMRHSVNHITDFNLAPGPTDMSTAGYDFLNFSLPSPNIRDASIHDDLMSYDPPTERQESEGLGCNCVSRLIKELLSLSSTSGGENAFFDAQLSQLRQAINVSEDCISCHCNAHDEMAIMTISILLGRVIQGFESTLIKTKPSFASTRPSSSDTSGTLAFAGPKLSWGELQIEPDEEDQLKQHLWLLQFRKLQRVIELFSESVSRLRSLPSSGHSAHVMACQCIHMWLTQKAGILKARYQAQDGGRAIAELRILS